MLVLISLSSILLIHSEKVIVVDQSGAGDFTTINEALDAVPLHNKDSITIKVNPGTYMYVRSCPHDNFEHECCFNLQCVSNHAPEMNSCQIEYMHPGRLFVVIVVAVKGW